MSSNAKGFIFIVVIVIAIVGGLIFSNRDNSSSTDDPAIAIEDPNTAPVDTKLNPDNRDASYISKLAKFMSEQGMTMYGASWCSHCNAQKKAFGESKKDLKYVECSDDKGEQVEVCSKITYIDSATDRSMNGIQGYPTWVYQGKGYSGERTIPQLAEIVGFVDETVPATEAPAN